MGAVPIRQLDTGEVCVLDGGERVVVVGWAGDERIVFVPGDEPTSYVIGGDELVARASGARVEIVVP